MTPRGVALLGRPNRMRRNITTREIDPARLRRVARLAEGEGFEPSVDRKAHNGFRDRPVQPLRHPSEARASERHAAGVKASGGG